MQNEIGPEHKVSRCNAIDYRGRVCPCCIAYDKKGIKMSFPRCKGKKDKTLRDHRK